jgi:glycosyltransferase involved in cell wall biosynthesis
LLRGSDWAFAYTEASLEWMLPELPRDRITVVDNAVDTGVLQDDLRRERARGREALRLSLGLGDGPVLLYLGALVSHKGVEAAVEAGERLRGRFPTLQMVVAGSGPLNGWLAERAATRPWLHRPGAVMGQAKARWLAAADMLVHPGQVGLGVFDAFAAGLPLVTCRGIVQPPEAAYLRHGLNAWLADPGPLAVAEAVAGLLQDEELRLRLAQGATDAAARLTLQGMVSRFVDGILRWLASAPRVPVRESPRWPASA